MSDKPSDNGEINDEDFKGATLEDRIDGSDAEYHELHINEALGFDGEDPDKAVPMLGSVDIESPINALDTPVSESSLNELDEESPVALTQEIRAMNQVDTSSDSSDFPQNHVEPEEAEEPEEVSKLLAKLPFAFASTYGVMLEDGCVFHAPGLALKTLVEIRR